MNVSCTQTQARMQVQTLINSPCRSTELLGREHGPKTCPGYQIRKNGQNRQTETESNKRQSSIIRQTIQTRQGRELANRKQTEVIHCNSNRRNLRIKIQRTHVQVRKAAWELYFVPSSKKYLERTVLMARAEQ